MTKLEFYDEEIPATNKSNIRDIIKTCETLFTLWKWGLFGDNNYKKKSPLPLTEDVKIIQTTSSSMAITKFFPLFLTKKWKQNRKNKYTKDRQAGCLWAVLVVGCICTNECSHKALLCEQEAGGRRQSEAPKNKIQHGINYLFNAADADWIETRIL